MTDTPQWALDRAREWLTEHSDAWHNVFVGDDEAYKSLAALLVEVSDRRFYRPDPLRAEDLLDGLPRLSTPEEALRAMGDGQKLVKMREYKR